jgi:peroxin-12
MQVLEWWFTAAEEELEAATRTVPPPPPMYSPHVHGIDLPDDTALCPVCKKPRTAPALLATSGYVFCYKCIFDAVSQYGCCPVTRIRGSPDEVRRLFLTS